VICAAAGQAALLAALRQQFSGVGLRYWVTPSRRSGRNRMMVRLLLIGIFAVVKAASAAQPMNPPGLMPTAIARPLFEQGPGRRRGAGRLGRGSARGEHSRSISV
jgi:hypothetical protein